MSGVEGLTVMSSTLTPFYASSGQYTLVPVSQDDQGATYKVAGRDLACPLGLEIQRKLTAPSALGNDHVVLRIFRTERNATTSKLATMQVLVDISIPKDTSIITIAEQIKLVAAMASLFNEETALEAFLANIAALIGGGDL
jgi:hypothetical protein